MFRLLDPGQAAPWFTLPAIGGNPEFQFDTMGGRHVVLLVMGSARHPLVSPALDVALRRRALFDDVRASFFGITCDAADTADARVAPQQPGVRFLLDRDRAVCTRLGAVAGDSLRPHWLLLDPQLRVVRRAALDEGDALLDDLAALAAAPPASANAPVLTVPGVFDAALCRDLIDAYDAAGGTPSGFMTTQGGRTVMALDPNRKRRADVRLAEGPLMDRVSRRLSTALKPMIARAFQFEVTRIERWLVSCYDAAEGGHFLAHRDNTTAGTAHRRFACTINLNAEDHDGGDLNFPEFGPALHRAPTGGAIVFSCSLLHEARPVTRGRRYAFLPFFYDDAAAAIRTANNVHLGSGVEAYQTPA